MDADVAHLAAEWHGEADAYDQANADAEAARAPASGQPQGAELVSEQEVLTPHVAKRLQVRPPGSLFGLGGRGQEGNGPFPTVPSRRTPKAQWGGGRARSAAGVHGVQ